MVNLGKIANDIERVDEVSGAYVDLSSDEIRVEGAGWMINDRSALDNLRQHLEDECSLDVSGFEVSERDCEIVFQF